MATPRLLQLSKDLADLLNDHVTNGDDSGEEFTKEQRLLALNKAEGSIISKAVAEQNIDDLEKTFNEILLDGSFGAGFSGQASPSGTAKVIRMFFGGSSNSFFIKTKEWFAVQKENYNPEQTQNYGTVTTFNWTEYGKKIYWTPNSISVSPTWLAVKDHVDLVYNGANDFLLPARYDTEILKTAYEFLNSILIKE